MVKDDFMASDVETIPGTEVKQQYMCMLHVHIGLSILKYWHGGCEHPRPLVEGHWITDAGLLLLLFLCHICVVAFFGSLSY